MFFSTEYLPVRLEFTDGSDGGWGRLLSLYPSGAVILTTSGMNRRCKADLFFEIGGLKMEGLRCKAVKCRADADGYLICAVEFSGEPDIARLRSLLADIICRT